MVYFKEQMISAQKKKKTKQQKAFKKMSWTVYTFLSDLDTIKVVRWALEILLFPRFFFIIWKQRDH